MAKSRYDLSKKGRGSNDGWKECGRAREGERARDSSTMIRHCNGVSGLYGQKGTSRDCLTEASIFQGSRAG